MPRNRNVRHLSSGGFEYCVEPDDQRLARRRPSQWVASIGIGCVVAWRILLRSSACLLESLPPWFAPPGGLAGKGAASGGTACASPLDFILYAVFTSV